MGRDAEPDRRGAVRGAAGRFAGPSALESGRAACRDAVERVKELYDRIRTALTAALRKLSAQYETEQRRHTEQVEALQQRVEQQAVQSETLRRQIEQLTGHVTGLDADYRTNRRDVARVVELMHRHAQQRARERDSAPSR